jgi:transposase-like protein
MSDEIKVMIKCPVCFQETPEPNKEGVTHGDVQTSTCEFCNKNYKWAVFNVTTVFVCPDYSFIEGV